MPALLFGALVLCFSTSGAIAQRLKDLRPPPPPPSYRPKPTPTPRPPADEDYDVVRVTSNLVMVPVSVVDEKGRPIRDLQLGDFRVEENGKLQQIAEIGDPEQVRLDIALLFDVSSSVSQHGFFLFQQKAAASFLRQVLKPADRAAVFTITDEPRLVQPLAAAGIATAKLLTIPAANSPVPTAFYDAAVAAAKYLIDNSPDSHRRVIVVISDGDDNFSHLVRELTIAEVRASERGEITPAVARQNLQERHRAAVRDVQRAVQLADAVFYSINPGGSSVHLNQISMRAEKGMEAIAASTGGTAFVPDSETDLERVFSEVAAELRGQYLLQYYSNSQGPGGQFRSIKVAVPAKTELHVRTRQGYYPKGK